MNLKFFTQYARVVFTLIFIYSAISKYVSLLYAPLLRKSHIIRLAYVISASCRLTFLQFGPSPVKQLTDCLTGGERLHKLSQLLLRFSPDCILIQQKEISLCLTN
jgi:hypothetical protein